MLTTTFPFAPTSFLALLISDRCPSCKYPIVGTRATHVPFRCHWRLIRCIPATDLTILMPQECSSRGNEALINLWSANYITESGMNHPVKSPSPPISASQPFPHPRVIPPSTQTFNRSAFSFLRFLFISAFQLSAFQRLPFVFLPVRFPI